MHQKSVAATAASAAKLAPNQAQRTGDRRDKPTPTSTHWRIGLERHPIHLDRTGDVLDLLRAEILEAKAQLVENLVPYDPAYADPARLGQCLQPRSDIDAVTEDVVAVDDDVTDVDTDTKVDSLFGGAPALRSAMPR